MALESSLLHWSNDNPNKDQKAEGGGEGRGRGVLTPAAGGAPGKILVKRYLNKAI